MTQHGQGESEKESLAGLVERVTFHSPDGNMGNYSGYPYMAGSTPCDEDEAVDLDRIRTALKAGRFLPADV